MGSPLSSRRGNRSLEKSNSVPSGIRSITGLLQEAVYPPVLPGDDDPELERLVHPLQRHGGRGTASLVEPDQLGQVHVRKGVPGQDQGPLVQERLGVADAARRAQRSLLGGVRQRQPEV
jgi:hypothetical protein